MLDKNLLRSKLQEKKAKQDTKAPGNGGDNASYAFWNIPDGSTTTVRFLPDGNVDNPFFWVNREVIRLPFEGVEDGENSHNRPVTVQVPCIEMWDMPCPILAKVRPMWKEPGKEDIARSYWKKRSYLFQGFVVNDPLGEESAPENPIRRFVVNKTIYDIIEASLLNDEMEDLPVDYVGGRDFKITKTRKGDYANYATSSWSMRTRSLSETEEAAIEQFGLFDLSQFLGQKPDADGVEALAAMFEASLAGEPYDMASFGRYYRPYGSNNGGGGSASRSDDVEARVKNTMNEGEAAPASKGSSSTQEILAKIKARKG